MNLSPTSKEVLSVAIEVGDSTRLLKLNQSLSLSEMIHVVCLDAKLPHQEGQYALMLSNQSPNNDLYINETNRGEIKDGVILKLVLSPSEMVKLILKNIYQKQAENFSDDEAHWTLKKLQNLSMDPIFSKEFSQKNGLPLVVDLILNCKLDTVQLGYCLDVINSMMEHKLVKTLNDATVQRIVRFIIVVISEDILRISLCIVEKLVTAGYSDYINKSLEMKHLTALMYQFNDKPVIIKDILALINAMGRSNNKKMFHSMALKETKQLIWKTIYPIAANKEDVPAKELYEYQSLVLSVHEKKLNTVIDPTGVDSGDISELNKIVSKENTNRYSMGSLLDDDQTHFYRQQDKASFLQDCSVPLPVKSRENPTYYSRSKSTNQRESVNIVVTRQPRSVTLDFSETKLVTHVSRLALACMLYFARRYPTAYVRMFLAEEASWKPFPITCQRITKLTCDVLGVRKNKGCVKKYQPLMFNEVHFFEEVFCRMLLQLGKTRKDMKARTELDQEKVISVVKRQLTEALNKQPISLKQLTSLLSNFNYTAISMIWLEEMKAKEDDKLKSSPPIKEFRESCTESIMTLIRQQRLNTLLMGTDFTKVNLRNHKTKSRTTFVILSSNQRTLHYHDRDEDGRDISDTSGKINVEDICGVIAGKKCPHVKEIKNFKPEYNLAFSLLLKPDQGTSLDLLAPHQDILDYWVDAINILLGKETRSKKIMEDLDKLLDIEVRLQLLDIDISDIPAEPPIIPQDPPNYDFAIEVENN